VPKIKHSRVASLFGVMPNCNILLFLLQKVNEEKMKKK
jgi:hypothetical protein